MIYYHCTDRAASILREGFRDRVESFGMRSERRGVFLGNSPASVNEGAKGDQVLAVEMPDDMDLDEYEWVEDEEHSDFREWCVPADLIAEHGSVRLLTQGEVDEVADREAARDPARAEYLRSLAAEVFDRSFPRRQATDGGDELNRGV